MIGKRPHPGSLSLADPPRYAGRDSSPRATPQAKCFSFDHLTFESPRFGNSKRRSRLFPCRLRDRQVGIRANGRKEFLLCFQRAVLFFPVISTSGTAASKLYDWQHSTIGKRAERGPRLFLLLTGAPLLQDLARLQ
jgi:hypothetical protein